VLDDITPLEQLEQARRSDITLFDVRPAISWRRFGPTNAQQGTKLFAAANPAEGAVISYYLKNATDHVRINVADRSGKEVGSFDGTGYAGVNRVNWDLHYSMPVPPSAEDRWATSEGFFAGSIHADGPLVEPGEYTVKLQASSHVALKTVRVDDDPAISISPDARVRRHDAMMNAYDLYVASAAEAQTVRTLRTQLSAAIDSWKGDGASVSSGVRKQADAFSKTVDDLFALFVGRQGGGGLTASLTYVPPPVPARLATVLHNIQSYTVAPRKQDLDKLAELTTIARDASARLKRAIDVDLVGLNRAMNEAGVPHITPPAAARPSSGASGGAR